MQFRRGTAAEWTVSNPVLAQGELGIELDTSLFKVGDGVTAWGSLAYGGLEGPQGASGATIAAVRTVFGSSGALMEGDEGALIVCDEAASILVPASSSVEFSLRTVIYLTSDGGQVTLVADGGVTLLTPDTLMSRTALSTIAIVQTATDVWRVFGDMEAA
ncbi:MAG: hypothetical protein NVV68_06790 [Dokdonella sp.]|nr:hypothetical protein [Dokdonella sp.]